MDCCSNFSPDRNAAAGMGTAMVAFSQIDGIVKAIQQRRSPGKWQRISSVYIKFQSFYLDVEKIYKIILLYESLIKITFKNMIIALPLKSSAGICRSVRCRQSRQLLLYRIQVNTRLLQGYKKFIDIYTTRTT